MYKLIFKRLLMSFYCASKWLTNKKMPERIVPSTILTFSFPFIFLATGIFIICFLIPILDMSKSTALGVFLGLLFISPVYYFTRKLAKNGLDKWHIEKEYKTLKKNERINKITLAFVVFFGSFIFQYWLANLALSAR